MGSPALNGTNVQKMNDAIVFSERNRLAADLRREHVIEVVGARVRRTERSGGTQSRMSNAGVEATADVELITDKHFNSRVGDEQWGTRLATMYAAAALAESVPHLTALLTDLLAEQRQTNRILRELVARTSPATFS